MELKDFIRISLVQIAEGIDEANNELIKGNSEAIVNPKDSIVTADKNSRHHGFMAESGTGASLRPIELIEFDVAVQAATNAEAGGSAGIQVFSVGIGGGAKKGSGSGSTSRISFQIPMLLPGQ